MQSSASQPCPRGSQCADIVCRFAHPQGRQLETMLAQFMQNNNTVPARNNGSTPRNNHSSNHNNNMRGSNSSFMRNNSNNNFARNGNNLPNHYANNNYNVRNNNNGFMQNNNNRMPTGKNSNKGNNRNYNSNSNNRPMHDHSNPHNNRNNNWRSNNNNNNWKHINTNGNWRNYNNDGYERNNTNKGHSNMQPPQNTHNNSNYYGNYTGTAHVRQPLPFARPFSTTKNNNSQPNNNYSTDNDSMQSYGDTINDNNDTKHDDNDDSVPATSSVDALEKDAEFAAAIQREVYEQDKERIRKLQEEQNEIQEMLRREAEQEAHEREQAAREEKMRWDMQQMRIAEAKRAQEEEERAARREQEDRELAQKLTVATFDCPVCMETCSMEDAFPLECGHTVCRACARPHVCTKLTARQLPVKCPMPTAECGRDMQQHEILSVLTPEEQEQYWELSLQAYAETDPTIKHCIRPNCRGLVAVDADDADTHCVCQLCAFEWCSACMSQWHEGATCEQFRKWRAENETADASTEEFIRQMGWPSCPFCHYTVEKNGGCDHIACRCGKHFSYSTGQPMNM